MTEKGMAMIVKRLAFPLAEDRAVLQEKWWHRLCVVIFVVCLSFFLVISTYLTSEFTTERSITIKDDLRNFSTNSDKSIPNTIPFFLKLGGKLGCLEDRGEVMALSSYDLEKTSYCSADLFGHAEGLTKAMQDEEERIKKSRPMEGLKKDIYYMMLNIDETYCFISEDVGCESANIIMYHINVFYYMKIVFYPLVATYIFSLFLQFVYFKGLIYIIYGRHVKPNMP